MRGKDQRSVVVLKANPQVVNQERENDRHQERAGETEAADDQLLARGPVHDRRGGSAKSFSDQVLGGGGVLHGALNWQGGEVVAACSAIAWVGQSAIQRVRTRSRPP